MENLLFSARSLWTMAHGIVLRGGPLLGLAAALFSLVTIRVSNAPDAVDTTAQNQANYLGAVLVFVVPIRSSKPILERRGCIPSPWNSRNRFRGSPQYWQRRQPLLA